MRDFVAVALATVFMVAAPFIAAFAVNAALPGFGAVALAVGLVAFPAIACRIMFGGI